MHGYLCKKKRFGTLKKSFFALACDGNLYQFNINKKNAKNENHNFMYEITYHDMLHKLKKINILDFINKPAIVKNIENGLFTLSLVQKTNGKVLSFTIEDEKTADKWLDSFKHIYQKHSSDQKGKRLNLYYLSKCKMIKIQYENDFIEQLRLLKSLQDDYQRQRDWHRDFQSTTVPDRWTDLLTVVLYMCYEHGLLATEDPF